MLRQQHIPGAGGFRNHRAHRDGLVILILARYVALFLHGGPDPRHDAAVHRVIFAFVLQLSRFGDDLETGNIQRGQAAVVSVLHTAVLRRRFQPCRLGRQHLVRARCAVIVGGFQLNLVFNDNIGISVHQSVKHFHHVGGREQRDLRPHRQLAGGLVGQDPCLVAGYVSGERDFLCCAPPVRNRLVQFPVSAPVLLNPDLHRRFRQVFVRFIAEFGARKPVVGIRLPPVGKHFRRGYGDPVETVVTGLEPGVQLLQRDLVVRGLHHIVPVQVMGRIVFPAILQVRNLAGRAGGILIAVSGRQHFIFNSNVLAAPELAGSHFISVVFLVIGACAVVRHVPGRGVVRMTRVGVRKLVYTETAFREIPLGMQILYGLLRAGPGDLLRVIVPGRIGFRQFPFCGGGDAVGLVRLHLLYRVGNPDVLCVPVRLFVKAVA